MKNVLDIEFDLKQLKVSQKSLFPLSHSSLFFIFLLFCCNTEKKNMIKGFKKLQVKYYSNEEYIGLNYT